MNCFGCKYINKSRNENPCIKCNRNPIHINLSDNYEKLDSRNKKEMNNYTEVYFRLFKIEECGDTYSYFKPIKSEETRLLMTPSESKKGMKRAKIYNSDEGLRRKNSFWSDNKLKPRFIFTKGDFN